MSLLIALFIPAHCSTCPCSLHFLSLLLLLNMSRGAVNSNSMLSSRREPSLAVSQAGRREPSLAGSQAPRYFRLRGESTQHYNTFHPMINCRNTGFIALADNFKILHNDPAAPSSIILGAAGIEPIILCLRSLVSY